MIYFDSSALVKRYLEEDGTVKVEEIIRNTPIVSTSKLTYPEMLSAFARKYKRGDIKEGEFYQAVDSFEADWNNLLIVEFQDEILPIINKIVKKYYMRGADSIQLSSALWLKSTVKENITFVASDKSLLKTAQLERLHTINPEGD